MQPPPPPPQPPQPPPPQPGWQPPPPPGWYGPYPPAAAPTPPARSNRVVIIVIVVVAVLMLCCGGTASVAAIWMINNSAGDPRDVLENQGAGDDDADDEEVTGPVEWWPEATAGGDTTLDQVWEDLAGDFSATGQGEVVVQAVPADTYAERLVASQAAGEGPDLFYSQGGGQLRKQVENGLLRDLTDELADVIATLSPATLAPYTIDGRVYGLPYHTGVVGLWYNKAHFAEAGLDPDQPPATWNEFLDAVEALKDAGISPIAIAGADNWTIHFWFGYLATRTAGVEGIAQAREARSFLEDPELLRAAELLEELIALEPFQPGYEGATYAGPGGQGGAMGSGAAAMELMGNWAPLVHELDNPDGLGEDLGWFRFPAVAGGRGSSGDIYGGGDGFVVGADAPDQTIELLRFLLSQENHERIVGTDESLLSTRTGAQVPQDPLRNANLATVQAAPAVQLYLDVDLPGQVGLQIHDSMGELLRGRIDAEQALAQITEAYQREPD